MKRVIIFIDGQNLFYGLKNIGILERDIQWDQLFRSLISTDDKLVRTYWFRPQKIFDTYFTTQNIKNQIVYKNYHSFYTIQEESKMYK